MLLDGYTDCIPGDITKTVTGAGSGATGVLDNYDNVARTWNVAKTAGTFLPTDICTLSGGGTGVGTVNTVSPALSEIDTQIADLQAKKIDWQAELIGL
jgi:hypothetical protein